MTTELLETQDAKGFFQECLNELIEQRSMDVGDHSVAYVANMLTTFIRSDRFYEWTPDGPTLTPLALLYAEMQNTKTRRHKQQVLRRLGDVALFVSGVFAESFKRKPYDVDYYIGMGGAAYGSLAEFMDSGIGSQTNSRMFAELSGSFAEFAEILGELCEPTEIQNDKDLLRCYELWRRTGSRRAAEKLRAAGISVADLCSPTRH